MITLWDEAVAPEHIPIVPGNMLKRATSEKDITYELHPTNPSKSIERGAIVGELLRQPNLRYIADPTENLKWRVKVTRQCDTDVQFRNIQIILCKSSILYWINTFVWTFNPRLKKDKTVPLVTYPFQDELVCWLMERIAMEESALVEKSREMGASWLACAMAVWLSLFDLEFVSYFMSMTEDTVDNRMEDSLLGKCRFILRNLPEWMRGGWIERAQGCDVQMALVVPQTQGTIKGILSKGTAARSGRSGVMFADEFAFVDDTEKVLKAMITLTGCKFFISTANGMG
ncbi:MAG TPA: hypothetical protein ENI27_00310, partial [bacterium]|nr:hypothetical protein [bacterium]